MKKAVILFVLFCSMTITAFGQLTIDEKGELSGLVFGDYFWMANHHNPDIEGSNGFWIRRIYLTYDRDFNGELSSRLRLEMSSEGDFVTSAKMTPVVKDAWLSWQPGRHEFTVGVSGTPTWGLTEDVWGYRSVEKTPLDLVDFGSSRDFGISAEGPLAADGKLEYQLMLGNGNSNKSETNRGKKTMLALTYHLSEKISVQAYGDWNDNPGNTDWLTAQGFIGYQSADFNLGVLYAHQKRYNALAGLRDLNLDVASLFSNFSLSGTSTMFLRVDRVFDPAPGTDTNDYLPISDRAESTIFIGGVDFTVHEKIHIMPNIETVFYDDPVFGPDLDSDIIPRMTLYYNF